MALEAIIAPSLLSCDFAIFAEEAQRMLDCGAGYLHIDVMDGYTSIYFLLLLLLLLLPLLIFFYSQLLQFKLLF